MRVNIGLSSGSLARRLLLAVAAMMPPSSPLRRSPS
jgi:hypothetical protein